MNTATSFLSSDEEHGEQWKWKETHGGGRQQLRRPTQWK
ncbi:hypothetical protein TIFTF001_050185 [Ficus carica]|uniref:Uncharacterized protein n=1 Tax=Ficus carica TaxID=3494 RepID=A0AA87ZCI4_FICCA|nr:hypothetical protein TIFTF001_050185 [Ficus carica]